MHNKNSGIKGRKAYNNGIKVIFLSEEDVIPEGFVKGGLSNRTPEQIRLVADKSRETQKRRWLEKSDDYKKAWSEKCKKAQSNLSDETKQHKHSALLETLSNKTEEEKNIVKNKISAGCKKAWSKYSIEDRKIIAAKIVTNGGGWNKDTIYASIKDKYGVDNVSQLSDVKEKVKITIAKTSQEIWGCDHPFLAIENREKAKEVIYDKYGVYNPSSSPIIKAKIKSTNMARYGTPYGFNFDKIRETCLNKYGVEYNCLLTQCKSALGSKCSDTKPNLYFAKLLDKYSIKYEREFSILNKSYDFKIGDILIEINPFATHNTMWGIFNKNKGLDLDYHYNKTKLAINNNYKCIHVWDWDSTDKILGLIKCDRIIYARECTLKNVSKEDCNKFLNDNHLQNTCNGQLHRFGLYYGKELVQLITFGRPRYNNNYQYELLRLCSKIGSRIVGGSEKLFNYFIRNFNPTSIISYCDNSKFTGNVYLRLGFTLKTFGNPTCHWYNARYNIHITDNLLRINGFDRLLGSKFGYYGKGTSNKQLMMDHGFVSIYDSGQSTYVWRLNN